MWDVALFLQGPESTGGPPTRVGARGAMPSAGNPFRAVERGPGLRILTPNDFALRLETSRAFAAASSLVRSGEVERVLA